jgi:hypothetical protein
VSSWFILRQQEEILSSPELPDRVWGLHIHICNGYLGLFRREKAVGGLWLAAEFCLALP